MPEASSEQRRAQGPTLQRNDNDPDPVPLLRRILYATSPSTCATFPSVGVSGFDGGGEGNTAGPVWSGRA